jgi:NAD(P)-dependent dehydrogenase (short-subunit alcohol dehydrogenase family)
MMNDTKAKGFPKQGQDTPGNEQEMSPKPEIIRKDYKGSDKLKGKTALITGGDSGIGRSAAVHFAKEGADVAIIYLEENEDAEETKELIENEGRRCVVIPGDLKDRDFCKAAVEQTIRELGGINILVNNAAEQHPHNSLEELDLDLMEETFKTNIFAMFYLIKAVVPHMTEGDCIINTTSVTAYRGSASLLDYSSTKGAITALTRSLSEELIKRKIRVNGVAPGPIWTPLIPSTFDEEKVKKFGTNTPMGRAGQPSEVGPAYVFLASEDASYMTGQVIHINGGDFINT